MTQIKIKLVAYTLALFAAPLAFGRSECGAATQRLVAARTTSSTTLPRSTTAPAASDDVGL